MWSLPFWLVLALCYCARKDMAYERWWTPSHSMVEPNGCILGATGEGRNLVWCLWGWTRSNQLVLYMLWLWSYSDVECALGDFSRLMPGSIYIFEGRKYEVVLNNHNTRPFCSQCHSRCKPPVILKEYGKDNGYICCYLCLSSFLRIQL